MSFINKKYEQKQGGKLKNQVDIASQYHTLNVLDLKLQQKIKVQKETKNEYHSH